MILLSVICIGAVLWIFSLAVRLAWEIVKLILKLIFSSKLWFILFPIAILIILIL